jgi:hypothetical protein
MPRGAKCLERLTANALVATVLGSIPASVGTVESEGRLYERKKEKNPPKKYYKKNICRAGQLGIDSWAL